ncbi:MAG TPA: TauD/TfdA family dioxygenase, partial [Verrucomicrobiae bacterium]|nr:TauD/TfdA family dioxygenase [Verrucomicrobiae bacterium]
IPPRGGDTLFVDTEALFADLAPQLRERLEKLTATHDILRSYGWKLSPDEQKALHEKHPPQDHPVVRVHPESDAKSLFVNPGFTTRINGVDEKESEELLNLLYDRLRIPEYQVRFSWTPNAIVFWDNRSTQHYPVADYWPHEREVERVTIVGDKPFGVS